MAVITPQQRERILSRSIEEEMRESFIDYSMSVIVQRALPDVRDGLKPVHRRILYAMQEAGLVPARPYKKSATVVGDVLGKYHPHGDQSVYDALVRMVQDFALRYPLVDGQGNFGSIDGDSPAAYRYTEARLSPLATELLADIEKDTVDFAPNFDDRLREPRVLPAAVPNLLVNGSSGIAVGMSTNVPPHNLAEVVAATVHLLDHPECTLDELMAHLPGPDFPTGGLILGRDGIRDAYATGRGRVVMRGRVYKESRRNGREQLVVTEIPYGTNKSRIIEQVAELTRAGKLADVTDLRDESDREGIRVVLELKRGADAVKVLTQLYKWTALQTTFGVISLALDNGVPREFPLKTILERFREHRIQVVVRRSRWELGRARDEAHVLEGLLAALRKIDTVIAIIRGSRNRETAARKLEKELKLTERQSDAILAMRLSRLTQLETRELRERLGELEARITELDALLASPERQVAVIRAELLALAGTYGDPRRTTILDESEKTVRLKDMLAVEEVVVMLTREGYVRQVPMPVYQRGVASGRGMQMEGGGTDFLERVLVAATDDTLLAFTADGRAYGTSIRELPEAGLTTRGKRLHAVLDLPKNAEVAEVHLVSDFREDRTVLFATAEGTVKRTTLDQFAKPRAGGVEAISLRAGDRLAFVAVTDGESEVVLAGRGGRAIRFPETDVPVLGRATQGVRGMKLEKGESLAGMVISRGGTELCAVTARGQAKRVAADELPLQKRDGKGAMLVPGGREYGDLVGLRESMPGQDLAALTSAGRRLRLRRDDVPALPREAPPLPVGDLAKSDRITLVTLIAERDTGAPSDTPPPAPPPPVGESGATAADVAGEMEVVVTLDPPSANGDTPEPAAKLEVVVTLDDPSAPEEAAAAPEPSAPADPGQAPEPPASAKPRARRTPKAAPAADPAPAADEAPAKPSAAELDLFG